jgi:hypothetical protein
MRKGFSEVLTAFIADVPTLHILSRCLLRKLVSSKERVTTKVAVAFGQISLLRLLIFQCGWHSSAWHGKRSYRQNNVSLLILPQNSDTPMQRAFSRALQHRTTNPPRGAEKPHGALLCGR